MTVRNATAAVIGAGDFIGGAIAKKFAAEGFTVFAGRRNGDKLAPLVQQIEAAGGRFVARSLDARKEDDITAFLREADADAPLEVCIFNIGANVNFPLLETTERVFRKVWEMACYAGFLTGREAARLMLPRGRGAIFFTGATASLRGGVGYAAFASRQVRPARAWPRARRANWGRRTSTSRTWSSTPASTPPSCASASGSARATAALAEPRARPADAAGVGRRGLLAPAPAAARRLVARARHPPLRREMVRA